MRDVRRLRFCRGSHQRLVVGPRVIGIEPLNYSINAVQKKRRTANMLAAIAAPVAIHWGRDHRQVIHYGILPQLTTGLFDREIYTVAGIDGRRLESKRGR